MRLTLAAFSRVLRAPRPRQGQALLGVSSHGLGEPAFVAGSPLSSEGPDTPCVAIEIGDGLQTIVDIDLREDLVALKWRPWISGTGLIYVVAHRGRGVEREGVFLHREILKVPEGLVVDHRDRDTLNNRRGNLRLATPSLNGANRRMQSNNTSGFRGVRLMKQKYWIAQIRTNGRQRYLGSFSSAVDAALAYDKACAQTFGEFGVLNFPDHAGARS